MSGPYTTAITARSDREIVITRLVDAPRALAFEAFTDPDLLKRWMYGPEEWKLAVCDVDLKVGGRLRYVWRSEDKGDMGLTGTFREIVAGERLVHTELFDEDWTGGEAVVTTVFTEAGRATTITMTIRYASREARDRVLESGMAEGMDQSYARLDIVLAGAATG